ncbi:MAG: serine hydrolase [Bacteroidota bacterium]
MKKIITFAIVACLLGSCRVVKYAKFYLSKNHQKPKFDEQVIHHDENNIFQFKRGLSYYDSLIANLEYRVSNYKPKKYPSRMSLDEYLDEVTKTTAFLVIRNDSILYERYFGGFDEFSQLPSFSVAKSFTSALVGIAVQEGFIKSINDPVTKYIEEVRGLAPEWEELTVEHLLNMRSGIDFNEDSYQNPYATIADLYMKKNVVKVIQKMEFKHPPGTRNYYSSMDTQILGLIVQRATGKSLAAYMEEKVWKPIGMESDARWFVDSKKYGIAKAFCCLHPIARDYAKFGRLYLNNGNWNGQQIIDQSWVEHSMQPDFDNNCYQYQWYSGGKGYNQEQDEDGKWRVKLYADSLAAVQAIENPEYQTVRPSVRQKGKWYIRNCGSEFYALGIFGQELHVFPEENLIFVRLGERWDTPTRNIIYQIKKALSSNN